MAPAPGNQLAKYTHLLVFTASPSDVESEIKFIHEIIDDCNIILQDLEQEFRLIEINYKRNAAIDVGNPNNVIQKQYSLEDMHIIVGVFWRRCGTPTGNINPEDGKIYPGGAIEEIERAIYYRKQTGSSFPLIHVYRKDDPPSGQLSDEDSIQYADLIKFFKKFEPLNTHPALYIKFKPGEFRDEVRRQLLRAAYIVYKHIVTSRAGQVSVPASGQEESFEPGVEEDQPEVQQAWMEKKGFTSNPFGSFSADYEDRIPDYFVHFSAYRRVATDILLSDPSTWVIYGKDGSGKTTLCKFLASRAPRKSIHPIIEDIQSFDRMNHLMQGDLDGLLIRFLSYLAQTRFGLKIKDGSTVHEASSQLIQNAEKQGYSGILCLLDPTFELFDRSDRIELAAEFFGQLIRTPGLDPKFHFRFILPDRLKLHLERYFSGMPAGRKHEMSIEWELEDLKALISRRLIAYSSNNLAPKISLGELCDPGDFSKSIDAQIAQMALGNPRWALSLANHLIQEHCISPKPDHTIHEDTWIKVQQDWYLRDQHKEFGSEGTPEELWLQYDQIYYKDKQISLSDQSERLLKCLIEANGRYVSDQDLIRIGWPKEAINLFNKKTLYQAMLRMKQELRSALINVGVQETDWVETKRNAGYRIIKPGEKKAYQRRNK